MFMAGNVFLKGAKPAKNEKSPRVNPSFDPKINLIEEKSSFYFHITLDKMPDQEQPRQLVTTSLLGRAKIPDLPYEQPNASPYRIDTDYFGKKRSTANPFPGPFEIREDAKQKLKVWPVTAP